MFHPSFYESNFKFLSLNASMFICFNDLSTISETVNPPFIFKQVLPISKIGSTAKIGPTY